MKRACLARARFPDENRLISALAGPKLSALNQDFRIISFQPPTTSTRSQGEKFREGGDEGRLFAHGGGKLLVFDKFI